MMTPEQAFKIIGQAVTHPSLKLSYQEHGAIQEALKVLQPKEEKCDTDSTSQSE
jgi:hypothetical protein